MQTQLIRGNSKDKPQKCIKIEIVGYIGLEIVGYIGFRSRGETQWLQSSQGQSKKFGR